MKNSKQTAAKKLHGGEARQSNQFSLNPSILRTAAIFLCFAILGFLLYSNTFESPFVFDDTRKIVENQSIRITELSAANLIETAFGKQSPKTRPIGNVTFALNYYFHQYNVEGYHLVNIVIHILAGIFLFIFVQTTLKLPSLKTEVDHTFMIAFFTALLWLVHPIQTQSVTYIVQRMNSMAALFYILAFWFYVKGRLAVRPGKKWGWFGSAALAWIFALGSKQNAATLPFFVFLYEWYFFQDLNAEWLKRQLKFIILIFFVFGLISLLYLGPDPLEKLSSIKDFANKEFTLSERTMTQFRVVIHYISLIFFPHPSRLNLDYDFALSNSLISPMTTLPSVVVIVGLVGLALYLVKRQRLISFCLLWFFGNLVIESSVIPLAIIFEHRLYLPSMLFCLIPVILIFRYVKINWLRIGALCAVAIVFSAWTYQRNQVWQNDLTIWSDCVKKSPHKARPHLNLGLAISKRGNILGAEKQYRQAVRLDPNYDLAHFNLASVLQKQGQNAEAVKHFTAAIQIRPAYVEAHNNLGMVFLNQGKTNDAIQQIQQALQYNPNHAKAHNNLGIVLEKQGNINEAIDHFRLALEVSPDLAEAQLNLAAALAKQGEIDQAIHHFTMVLRSDPNRAEAHNGLGALLIKNGKIEKAISHFREALRIKPDYIPARNNLKKALSIQKLFQEKSASIQEALKNRPNDPLLHYEMGNLYLAKGELNKAISEYQKALALQPRFPQALNNLALVYAKNKEYAKALSEFHKMLDHWPDNAETYYNIACMYSRLNRVDESIEWLKKAIDKGYTKWKNIKTDSDLENIRDSFAYRELIKDH